MTECGSALGRAHDRLLRERAQDLFDRLLRGPALGAVEVRDRLAPVDLLDQIRAHVFVLESQGVTGLVPHDPPELRLGGAHREALEVEGRLVLLDAEDLGADVRPVPRLVFGLVEPRDAHLADAGGLDKLHVRRSSTRRSCAAGCGRAGRAPDCRETARSAARRSRATCARSRRLAAVALRVVRLGFGLGHAARPRSPD